MIKFIALAITVLLSTSVQAKTYMPLKEFLKKELSQYPKLTREIHDGKDGLELKKVTFYFGKKSKDAKPEKVCSIIPQEGKEGPMQIGVCFDMSGNIQTVDFLEYNEERGEKVRKNGFANQFVGKNASVDFAVGKNIDIVSGASYSSKAVTNAVRNASKAFNIYVRGKK